MRSARWTTEPPIAVGSRYDRLARFLRKDVRTIFEVTALEPGRSITIASLPGSSFPIRITRQLEPLGPQRTRVRETAAGDSSGFYRLTEPLIRPMVRRNIVEAYRRLKQLLEA